MLYQLETYSSKILHVQLQNMMLGKIYIYLYIYLFSYTVLHLHFNYNKRHLEKIKILILRYLKNVQKNGNWPFQAIVFLLTLCASLWHFIECVLLLVNFRSIFNLNVSFFL